MPLTHLLLKISRSDARRVFARVDDRDLVLAVLAGIIPPPIWDGSEVSLGSEDSDFIHLISSGADPGDMADGLAEQFGRLGVGATVEPLPAAGPGEPLVTVAAGQWRAR